LKKLPKGRKGGKPGAISPSPIGERHLSRDKRGKGQFGRKNLEGSQKLLTAFTRKECVSGFETRLPKTAQGYHGLGPWTGNSTYHGFKIDRGRKSFAFEVDKKKWNKKIELEGEKELNRYRCFQKKTVFSSGRLCLSPGDVRRTGRG